MSKPALATSQPSRSRHRLHPLSWRVGYKLGVAMLALAVIPLVLLAVLGAQRLRTQAREDGRSDLEGVVAAVAFALDTEIKANLQVANSIATDQRVIDYAEHIATDPLAPYSDDINALLLGIKTAHTGAGGVFLLDSKGIAIAASETEILGKSYEFRRYFQDAIAGRTNISDVYIPIGTVDATPGTAFAAPIKSRTGQILGIAAIRSSALTISESLTSSGDQTAFLVESTGLISADLDPDRRFKSLVKFTEEQQAAADASKRFEKPVGTVDADKNARSIVGATEAGFVIGEIDHETLALAWQPLTETNWIAVASKPYAEFSSSASAAFTDALRFAAIVAVIAAALAVLAALWLGKPITLLTSAARRLAGTGGADDDLPLERLTKRSDDLGSLAEQLVVAKQQVRERERRAAEQVRALKVEIDQIRRESEVGEIVESEFFAELEARAAELRRSMKKSD